MKTTDIVLSFLNNFINFLNLLNFKQRAILKLNDKNLGEGGDVFIVLNGPSISNQDLCKLEGKCTIFVNRGYQHSCYERIKPKYHVFVDSKMLNGIWSIDWFYKIKSLSPDTTFILPVSWYHKKEFKELYLSGVKIHWMTTKYRLSSLGVAGNCIEFAMQQNFKKIFITGFEATGIAHELCNSRSHFYGINSENNRKNTLDYAQDLYMHSTHLRSLNRLADYASKKDIKIVNLTQGGILDMFQREDFNKAIE